MQNLRIGFTVIMALILMGCPPPVSDNPAASASADNAPPPGDPEPKAIVVDQVSAGELHTMIIMTDGTLWAVGDNPVGQLGDGSMATRKTPVQVKTAGGAAMTEVRQVSAGSLHSMILKSDDTLWGTGYNSNGQLGDGTGANTSTPVAVRTAPAPGGQPLTNVKQVSAGAGHTVIVMKNGDLWAVGKNDKGQLGDGTDDPGKLNPVQVMIAADRPMTQVDLVSTGSKHTVILKTNGELWAVGHNAAGQLGDGSIVDKKNPVQVMIAADRPMTEVASVSAGGNHTMIVKQNGDLWAVGDNQYGQLGDGTTNRKLNPVQVMIAADRPMTEVDQVSAGAGHTLILKTNGDLWAVGGNGAGQLGNDDDTGANELNPVEIMAGVAQVSAGLNHTMILKKNGSLWAVGRNNFGQLGDPTIVNTLIPVEITVR